MRPINRLIIHCSASEGVADVVSIRKFHTDPPPKGRGWKDIGYHYVVTRKGEIQSGRPEEEIGAHCEGYNKDSIGVCLGGIKNFDQVQLEALRYIVRELMLKHKLTFLNVYCHYELDTKGKTCPNLPADLLRAYVKV